VEAVAYHHRPREAAAPELDAVTAVHVADALVAEVGGEEGMPTGRPPLDEGLLERLGVADRLDEWRSIAARVVQAA
jgi:hypothetical protein